tara:strand:+ start:9431 stop:10129 length:699 start_codon:yes stop_codon:yes gene_type:complete
MNNNPLVSICIPTCDMSGRSVEFLTDLFDSIKKQTYNNIQIVVSDQSDDDEIEKLCNQFRKKHQDLKYCKDKKGIKSCGSNLNNAMDNADGEFIKMICQDDLLYSNQAIQRMMEQNSDFVACSCKHFAEDKNNLYNPHTPSWHNLMPFGMNKIGAFSVVLFRKTTLRLDTNLIWLVDCEFYHRLSLECGLPVCIDEHLVNVRHWNGSVSDSIDQNTLHTKELKYVKNKMGIK